MKKCTFKIHCYYFHIGIVKYKQNRNFENYPVICIILIIMLFMLKETSTQTG